MSGFLSSCFTVVLYYDIYIHTDRFTMYEDDGATHGDVVPRQTQETGNSLTQTNVKTHTHAGRRRHVYIIHSQVKSWA